MKLYGAFTPLGWGLTLNRTTAVRAVRARGGEIRSIEDPACHSYDEHTFQALSVLEAKYQDPTVNAAMDDINDGGDSNPAQFSCDA